MFNQKEYQKEYARINREKKRQYRINNKETIKQYEKKYYQVNKEKILEYSRHYQKINRKLVLEKSQQKKQKVIEHYSNGSICCGCKGCTENDLEFLAIDHVNQDGAEHRKTVGCGNRMYNWLVKNKFPEGYQVLCHNCNMARSFPRNNGICPHEQTISKITGITP